MKGEIPIPATHAEAGIEIERLVERFARNLDAYKRAEYKETQVRVEFIDPMFEALGWDVRNVRGYAEQYKDVVHEDAIKVGGATRAPDYSFRVGGVRKFFLEAKKPSVWVKGDVGPAYQLRRYAWSAKLPLSILTDFEEFAVYDCRQRPKPDDKPGVGRIMYLTFDQYLEKSRFDDIYTVFARESVLKGSFDRYVQDTRRKRGTSEVDAEFLKEIENWRDALARNVALRNPALSVHELNFAVQRTIDRVIFLRMCEDRSIEEYGRLLALTGGPHIYARMHDLYRQAEEKYNSGIFDFQADTLSKSLTVDDKVLKPILAGLYYPQSPYEFSVLPPEVLGQVYEQFLGKVIRLTPAHRAKVEEKPEVKKAGGVYYTPTYIVDYIVRQTVGKLIEGKTPRQIAGAHKGTPLRILDPACGSGSFLLGAYQYLLDYHRCWYEAHDPVKHARGKRPAIYQASPSPPPLGPPQLWGGSGEGEWRLTTAEKKRILLNNIYGVDIDRQAVEVTKLSLLLKVLEGESQETLGRQLALWRERALPDLGDNIKCGNSLIGPDYFAAQLLPLENEEEMRRVNVFDWEAEFSEIMAAGGFDAVIGNPPYIRIQTLPKVDKAYYNDHYQATTGNYDIYVLFIERGWQLLRPGSVLGFILPHRFFKTSYGKGLREFIAKRQNVREILDFDGYMVFEAASINTCILIIGKEPEDKFKFGQVRFIQPPTIGISAILQKVHEADQLLDEDVTVGMLSQSNLTEESWSFLFPNEEPLWQKLNSTDCRLSDIATHVFQGLKTGGDSVYSLRVVREDEETTRVLCSRDSQEYEVESAILKPLIKGGEMKRYHIGETNRRVLFPYKEGKLIPADDLQRDYPRAWDYLSKHKEYLKGRERGKMKGPNWYAYTRNQALNMMWRPKILTPEYYAHASYCYDKGGEFYFFGGGAGGYGIVLKLDIEPCYVLGLLNSKLLDWYLQKISVRAYQTAYLYVKRYIEQLPIRTINFSDPADKARHDKMVALVEHMLALHRKLAVATVPPDKELYQRQIEATDLQIDALVYELYGLSEATDRSG